MKAIITWIVITVTCLIVMPTLGWNPSDFFHQYWPKPVASFLSFLASAKFLLPVAIPVCISGLFGKSRPTTKEFYRHRPVWVFVSFATAAVIWLIMLVGWKTEITMPNSTTLGADGIRYDWLSRLGVIVLLAGVAAFFIKRPLTSSFFKDLRQQASGDNGSISRTITGGVHWWSLISLLGTATLAFISFEWLSLDSSLAWKLIVIVPAFLCFWLVGGVMVLHVNEIGILTSYNNPNPHPWVLRRSVDHQKGYIEQDAYHTDKTKDSDGTVLRTGLNIYCLPFWLPFIGITLLTREIEQRFGTTPLFPTKPVASDGQPDDPNRRRLVGPKVQIKFRMRVCWNEAPFTFLHISFSEQNNIRQNAVKALSALMVNKFSEMSVEEVYTLLHYTPYRNTGSGDANRITSDLAETPWDRFQSEAARLLFQEFGARVITIQIEDINLDPDLERAIQAQAAATTEVERQTILGQAEGRREASLIKDFARQVFGIPANQEVSEAKMLEALAE